MSGFIGYLLLGLYFRRFVPAMSWRRTLAVAVPVWLAGFAVCFAGFLTRVYATGSSFPIAGPVDLAVGWETPWYNDTVGVALMTIGWLLFFRKLNSPTAGSPRASRLATVSKATYGMYLSHMFVLAAASEFFRDALGIGADGSLGFWTTPVEIALTAITTFAVTAIGCIMLQRIPRIGRWLAG